MKLGEAGRHCVVLPAAVSNSSLRVWFETLGDRLHGYHRWAQSISVPYSIYAKSPAGSSVRQSSKKKKGKIDKLAEIE